MNLSCSDCGRKTDALTLHTINGRDNLLCKRCENGGSYERDSVSRESSLGVSDEGRERHGNIQPA